ncbi:unnamed protein product [Victoria cruziana]
MIKLVPELLIFGDLNDGDEGKEYYLKRKRERGEAEQSKILHLQGRGICIRFLHLELSSAFEARMPPPTSIRKKKTLKYGFQKNKREQKHGDQINRSKIEGILFFVQIRPSETTLEEETENHEPQFKFKPEKSLGGPANLAENERPRLSGSNDADP